MQAILWPIVSWVFREVIIRFVVMGALVVVVGELAPWIAGYVVGFISPTALTSAFAAISPGMWWWLDAARLDYGVPLLLSAWVSRFLIRRVPFLG